MYHYRESGLSNVYLTNGYREVVTAYGRSVVIEDVEGLHAALATTMVIERQHLTGREVRFIRKFLSLTQAQLANLLGVEEQSVRRWEKLGRVPKAADHSVRLIFLDSRRPKHPKLPQMAQIVEKTESAETEPQDVRARYRPRAKADPWVSEFADAA